MKVYYVQPCSDVEGWQKMLVDLEPVGDSDELRRMTLPQGVGRVYTADEDETTARRMDTGDDDVAKGKSDTDNQALEPTHVVAPDELRRNSVLSQRADVSTVLRPPSDIGVSIGAVQHLLKQVKSKQNPDTPMTTRQLVEDIIRPASGNKSYTEHLDSAQENAALPGVGPACVFVTHAWDDSAEHLLESIVYHNNRVIKGLKEKHSATTEEEPAPLYYWVDICCLNQGSSGDAVLAAQKSDEKWWSVAFPSLIKNVGYSILVLCPPTHDETSTVVSQRAWCLYEVVVAYGLDVGIDIVNGPSTDASLEEQLRTNFAAFADAVMKVDSRAATTSVPEDVDNIHRIVASVPGDHATVDDIYKNLVKGWIVRVMRDLCDKQTDETEENANFAFRLGSVLRQSGDLDNSILYLQKSMNMFEATVGAAHPTMGDVCNSLGVSYANKGDYDNGIHFYDMAARIYKASVGPDDDKMAQIYNNLGVAHAAKGHFDVAIEFYEKDRVITEAKLGTRDPVMGGVYNNLSSAYYNKGVYDKAIEFLEKEKEITEATHGPEHPALAELYNLLALSHWKLGNKDVSIAFFEKDKELSGGILGFDHPNMAQRYSNLGTTYVETNKYDVAIEYYNQALAIYTAAVDANHPLVRKTFDNLAFAYESKQEFDRALEYYEKVNAINEATVEALHPLRADSCQNIGRVHVQLGAYDDAIKYFTKAKGIVQVNVGTEHSLMGQIQVLLGEAYEHKKDFDNAVELYTAALGVFQAVVATADVESSGTDSAPQSDATAAKVWISDAFRHLGSVLMKKGDIDGALVYFEKDLAHTRAVLGADHASVAVSYRSLGDAHKHKGCDEEASKCYAHADALAPPATAK